MKRLLDTTPVINVLARTDKVYLTTDDKKRLESAQKALTLAELQVVELDTLIRASMERHKTPIDV